MGTLAAALRLLSRGEPDSRPSLLYDAAQAADIDTAAVYQLGLSGFAELCRADARFEAFARSLFAKASAEFNRELQDADANSRLDAALDGYLRLLGAYFLLPAATHTLEYLIRRFKVHQYNVDAAVACALPYHATPQFLRLVQVLQLEGTRWTFLSAVKTQGAPPTRDALVACVARDGGLLALVADAAAAAATGSARNSRGVATTFYTLLLTEAVASMTRVPEALLPRLLVYINAGLDKSASLDHHAGALILITQLASRVQLAQPVVEALLVGVAKAARAPLETHTLQVVLQLVRTQAVATLPPHAVTFLVKISALPQLLVQLSRSCSAQSLVTALVSALAERLGAHHTYRDALVAIVSAAPMNYCAELLAAKLFAAAGPTTEQAADNGAAVGILRTLHRRCPAEVELAASHTLRSSSTPEARAAFAAFIREALAGTAAQPLPGHDAITLGAGMEHETPHIREAALRELARLADTLAASGVAAAAEATAAELLQPGRLRDVLLRRIADTDFSVVAAALAICSLADLVSDDGALFGAGVACLTRAVSVLDSVSSPGGKAGSVRAAAKRALKLLAVVLPQRTPSLRDAAACLLLEHVVGSTKLQNLAQQARSFAADFRHPLFASVPRDSAAAAEDAAGAAHRAQQLVLSAMGDALCASPGDLASWAQASWPDLAEGGQLTLLLALHRALARAPDAATAARLAGAAWELLLQNPGRLCAAGASTEPGAAWADGLPSVQVLESWAPRDAGFAGGLRRTLLLAVIEHLQASASDEKLADLGVLGQAFALCCSMPGSPAVGSLLDAVLARARAAFSSSSRFLCLLVSGAADAVPEPAQLKAVLLLGIDTEPTALAHLFVALASPRRAVRRAAVEVISQMSRASAAASTPARGKKQAGKAAARGETANAAGFASSWVDEHRSAIVASGNTTLAELLREALLTADSLPLRQLFLDFLRNSVQPAASLTLVAALRGAGQEDDTALALLPLWDALRLQLVHTPVELHTADAVCCAFAASAPSPGGAGAQAALVDALSDAVAAPLRAAVLSSISTDVYKALPAARQDAVLQHCVLAASADESAACREASRAIISRLPLDGGAFARVVQSACAALLPGKKRSQLRVAALPDAESLDVLTAAFEVLSWRHVDDAAALLPSVMEATTVLLDAAAVPHQEAAAGTDNDTDDAAAGRPALEYRLQLAFGVLTALVRISGSGCAVQLPLVVRALREVSDSGVHNAALELLTATAAVSPEHVVAGVMDITVALTARATAGGGDRATARALQDAFAAIGACWAASHDDGGAELLQHVTAALPSVAEHQRLPLMAALLRSLPSPLALTLAFQLLVAQPDADPERPVANAMRSLAAALCFASPPLDCVKALCGLLQRADADDAAFLASAVEFVGQQLRAPGRADWVAVQGLSASLTELLALGLALQKRFTDKQELSADGQRVRQSLKALLAAVEFVMAPLAFLQALTQLFDSAEQQVQRRALRLFLARVRASAASAPAAAAEHSQLVGPVVALVRRTDKTAVTTRCAALAVFAALIARFGQSPDFAAVLLPAMPDVLDAARHAKPQVAAHGLDCIAAAVSALSTRAVPLLPTVVPAILEVLEAADEDAGRQCAALGAITTVVQRMDAFMSPFAQRLVTLLLAPRFVSGAAEGMLPAAAAARGALAKHLPARLLVEPLTSAWDAAFEAGEQPSVALLQQMTVLVNALDDAAAVAHHEAIFAFFLRCLDVRRLHRLSPELDSSPTTDSIESATVSATVALVLKLSEARFTPLFMTALEWSRARTEGGARPLAFFRLVSALAAALRSVFVPFFRHLLSDAVSYLEQRTEDAARPAKKARSGGVAASTPRVGFRLRTEVLRALRSCFLHDSVGFLDEMRFNKLMGPLVQQLELVAPADASAAETADMDDVLVDCLVNMAQTVRQDTLWRPLNRGVLLATRSEHVRPRRLGLAVLTKLADTLAEEYLVLLPETLPFLAELMEDADEGVEAAARQLVTNLSTLAEEDVAELLKS